MYGNVEDFETYLSERGLSAPASGDANLPALQRASDYIKYHYVVNFRNSADEAADEVVYATYEAALIESNTPGFFEKKFSQAPNKTLVAVESVRWEKVASKNMDQLDNSPFVPVSTKVEMYLRQFMRQRTSFGIFSVGPRS